MDGWIYKSSGDFQKDRSTAVLSGIVMASFFPLWSRVHIRSLYMDMAQSSGYQVKTTRGMEGRGLAGLSDIKR